MKAAVVYADREAWALGLTQSRVLVSLHAVETLMRLWKAIALAGGAGQARRADGGTVGEPHGRPLPAGAGAPAGTDAGSKGAPLSPKAAARALARALAAAGARPASASLAGPVSADGLVLMVDFELVAGAEALAAMPEGERPARLAVYLSPSLAASRQAGRTLEEAVIVAIAATHTYASVH